MRHQVLDGVFQKPSNVVHENAIPSEPSNPSMPMNHNPTLPRGPRVLFSRRFWLPAMLAAVITPSGAAPVPMTGVGSYSQDFDTLASSGTSNAWADDSTIAGWYSQRTGTGATYRAGLGSETTGDLYSYGSTSSSERALGTLGSGNAAAGHFAHGVQLQNTSGGTLTINSLAYTGEQWRNSAAAAQAVTLWYQVSASPITSLTPGADVGWTAVSSGDFTSPITGGTAGALDGNAVANRTAISINPDIGVPDGNYVMIRWKDPDHAGSDHGLAIDDVSLAWTTSSTPGLGLSATPDTFSESAANPASVGTITIPSALGEDLTVNLQSSDLTEATVPATAVIPAGETSVNFDITAVDDLLADGSQPVTITASASGYINAQFGLTVEDDTDAPIAVSVVPSSFAENAGPDAATGTVTVAANVVGDLTVILNSSDTTEATVPGSVTILDGTNSITFSVDAVDDDEVDGTRNVTIQASATGYTSGSTVIQVTDFGDTPPAPTLSPGAIAFTGFNADGSDDLAFVALAPIAEGDVIHFTDNEWDGGEVGAGGSLNTGEGYITWTAPAGGVAQGQIVSLNSLSVAGRNASVGTIQGIGSFNLGASAETVYAYQGGYQAPTGFLAVIATTTGDSVAGTGLSAEHVIYLPSNVDVAAYTGARSGQPTFAAYLALLGNTATNWVTQDGGGDQHQDSIPPDLPFDLTPFTIGSGGSGYASWIDSFFPGETDPLIIGFNADPDGDGIPSGVEAFFGSAPDSADGSPYSEVIKDGGTFSFVYPQAKSPVAGLTVSYVWSTDAVNWQGSGESFGGVTVEISDLLWDDSEVDVDLYQVIAEVTAGTAPRLFVRVVVNEP